MRDAEKKFTTRKCEMGGTRQCTICGQQIEEGSDICGGQHQLGKFYSVPLETSPIKINFFLSKN